MLIADRTPLSDEAGVTLVEFLIAATISVLVLTAGATVATQVQHAHRTLLDQTGVEEEARFAIDLIERTLRAAGNNPYGVTTSDCPAASTPFVPITLDPNGNGVDDNVRVQADIAPSNGLLGGVAGTCTEAGEDITIAHDPIAQVVTFRDNNVDATPVAVTDAVITALTFDYRNAAGVTTTNPAAVAFIQTTVTARGRAANPQTGAFDTFTERSEIRVRAR
jgi:Tfp pilus assembly protein PilW